MGIKYSASMMCANFANLEKEVRDLEEAGIDSFHIDMMDGQFVHNFGMGIQDLELIRKITKKPVELHLMLQHPGDYLDIFINEHPDVIFVHPEADYHPTNTLTKIRNAGIKPGLVINPGTSVEYVRELLYYADEVMVMSVNPGNAGQQYLPYVGQKIDRLLELCDKYQFHVCWDGACGEDKIKKYAPRGVEKFVLGTTVLFGHHRSYKTILSNLHEQEESIFKGR